MRKIVLLLLPVILVAVGWSVLWDLAAREADRRVDAWISSERTLGRNWTCPDRQVTGFPIALAVSCTNPTYTGQAMRQRVDASMAQLVATVRLSEPRHVALQLQPPFSFRTSDGSTDVKGTWRTLHLDLSAIPDIRSIALHGSGIVVGGTFAGTRQQGSRAEALDSRFTMVPDEHNPTLAFEILVKSIAVPALDDVLGGTDPVDLVLAGHLDHADVSEARTPEQAMDRWRQAGGKVDFDRSSLSRAGASISATGTLRLDESHRPKGRLDAEFLGLEPILARYGIGGNLAAVGSLIGTLFGNGGHKTAPRPGVLALPISLNNGRVGVGPITLDARLNPLY